MSTSTEKPTNYITQQDINRAIRQDSPEDLAVRSEYLKSKRWYIWGRFIFLLLLSIGPLIGLVYGFRSANSMTSWTYTECVIKDKNYEFNGAVLCDHPADISCIQCSYLMCKKNTPYCANMTLTLRGVFPADCETMVNASMIRCSYNTETNIIDNRSINESYNQLIRDIFTAILVFFACVVGTFIVVVLSCLGTTVCQYYMCPHSIDTHYDQNWRKHDRV